MILIWHPLKELFSGFKIPQRQVKQRSSFVTSQCNSGYNCTMSTKCDFEELSFGVLKPNPGPWEPLWAPGHQKVKNFVYEVIDIFKIFRQYEVKRQKRKPKWRKNKICFIKSYYVSLTLLIINMLSHNIQADKIIPAGD